jgi:replicative DNA helicase
MSGRHPAEDPALRLSVEWGTWWPVMLARPDKAQAMLAQVTTVLSTPLHRWFDHPVCKAIAVAMDAAVRNEIQPTSEGVLAYLAGLPHATMFEIVTGKPVLPWKVVEYDQSALAAIGGYNAVAPSEDTQLRISGQFSGSPQTLRGLVERDEAVDLLRDVARQIKQCDLRTGPSEVLAQGIGRITQLVGQGNRARGIGDCLISALETAKRRADDRSQSQQSDATWGIPQLDLICPFRPGRLYVLSAPPSAGKSSLALQAATATSLACGRHGVAIVSKEMPGEELSLIMAARELGIAVDSIENWTETARRREADLRALAAKWQASEGILVRDTTGSEPLTAQSITGWLRTRQMVTQNRMALAVIDHLHILDGKPNQREYDKLTEATGVLKQAAMALRIPILLLAQQSREGRKADRNSRGEVTTVPEPRIEDMRGSGSIEQDADAIIFMHFPGLYGDKQATQLSGKVIVAKQRNGPKGEIDVVFHKRHRLTTYCGLPPEMDEPRPVVVDNRMNSEPSPEEDHFHGRAAR